MNTRQTRAVKLLICWASILLCLRLMTVGGQVYSPCDHTARVSLNWHCTYDAREYTASYKHWNCSGIVIKAMGKVSVTICSAESREP